jgi:hypothetical protein
MDDGIHLFLLQQEFKKRRKNVNSEPAAGGGWKLTNQKANR